MSESPFPPAHRAEIPLEMLVVRAMLREWRRVLLMSLALAAATAAVVLLSPRTYSATFSFAPEGEGGGRLAGLAAQFGFDAGSDASKSPDFYADLLQTEEVRRAVVRGVRVRGADGAPRTLLQDLNVEPSADTLRAYAQGAQRLRARMVVATGRRTGVVRVTVRTGDPRLSAATAESLLAQVHHFNLASRQSRGRAERVFTEQRLAVVRAEAADAERRLRAFLTTNREYRMWPALQLEYERLARDVAQRQVLVTSLQQAYEQARLDEVRNTPQVTVVEPIHLPAFGDPRGTLVRTALGALIGLIAGVAWAAWGELRNRRGQRAEPEPMSVAVPPIAGAA